MRLSEEGMPLRRESTWWMKLFGGSAEGAMLPWEPDTAKSHRWITAEFLPGGGGPVVERDFSGGGGGSVVRVGEGGGMAARTVEHAPMSRLGATVRLRRSAPVSSS